MWNCQNLNLNRKNSKQWEIKIIFYVFLLNWSWLSTSGLNNKFPCCSSGLLKMPRVSTLPCSEINMRTQAAGLMFPEPHFPWSAGGVNLHSFPRCVSPLHRRSGILLCFPRVFIAPSLVAKWKRFLLAMTQEMAERLIYWSKDECWFIMKPLCRLIVTLQKYPSVVAWSQIHRLTFLPELLGISPNEMELFPKSPLVS